MSISVIIIAKNEEDDIKRCLDSVSWATEIIVVDSGSTDKTVEICKEYTDHVYFNEWPGFGPQKNFALDKASCNWVLSLDADEWCTDQLKREIQEIIKTNANDAAYYIPRKSYYCGKLLQYGHWSSDKVLRLFRKSDAKFSNDKIHEKLLPNANVKTNTLKQHLLHNTFTSHDDVINTMNNYSTLLAEQKFNKNEKSSVIKAILKASWAFINSYVLRLGFLDGKEGLFVAISFAEGTFYKYIKLIQLHEKSNLH